MKEAIMGLDGGGSNLRILVVDRKTEQELYSKDIETGTNLSTVADKDEALRNVRELIVSGFKAIPDDYCVKDIEENEEEENEEDIEEDNYDDAEDEDYDEDTNEELKDLVVIDEDELELEQ